MPNEFMIYEEAAGDGKFTAAIQKVQKGAEQQGIEADVANVQAEVLLSLSRREPLPNVKVKLDLSFVREHTPQVLVAALGDVIGPALKAFAESADTSHPVFNDVFAADGFNPKTFVSTLREILEVAALAGERTQAMQMMRAAFCQQKAYRPLRNLICNPPARCWSTREARDAARLKKEQKQIDLRKVFEERRITDMPGSLLGFVRLSDAAERLAKENRRRAEQMNALGLASMSATFTRRNQQTASAAKERYCGFTRMKMGEAAAVAAKFHGAKSAPANPRAIYYSRAAFAKPFWLDSDRAYAVDDHGKGRGFGKLLQLNGWHVPESFMVTPRAYPLCKFGLPASEHAAAVVAAVEEHADAGGRALFDHYWVVVPGVHLPPDGFTRNGRWMVRSGDRVAVYDAQPEAHKAIDTQMVRDGLLHPVLLGEHQGKCYFLTIFS